MKYCIRRTHKLPLFSHFDSAAATIARLTRSRSSRAAAMYCSLLLYQTHKKVIKDHFLVLKKGANLKKM